MKVFVLGLDGLEYMLVSKWKLENLMQVKYGYFEVSEEYAHKRGGVPYTPIIWASFITGKKPSEHGVRELWTYGKFLDKLRHLPPIKWIKGKRRFLSKLGLKPKVVGRETLNCPTIFDVINPSIAVNVPSYNESTHLHRRLSEAFYRGLEEYEKEIWRVHEERKKATYDALRSGYWKLFMTYFDLADLLGHLHFIKRPFKLLKAYLELNNLAGELQSRVPNDTVFLIISDHGMEPSGDGVTGNHSKRAFWSLNLNEKWEPRDFTDFFPKIMQWLNYQNIGLIKNKSKVKRNAFVL
ncbi:MAG: hypothetical protein DRJ26_02990 [Candidatus Methanomethylicota archaeon]|uniref:Nucleotide pyrophosphatase n=1 Tax=Thermoproteota archaeon TaxID=2056631 RepID=A0A497F2M3_9CREN|nr:MAG: hypothetical protein DRJ26_02990 [Candidatus Verstraetearchaeota archaeon]